MSICKFTSVFFVLMIYLFTHVFCCFCTIGTTNGKYIEFLAIHQKIDNLPENLPFGGEYLMCFFNCGVFFYTFGTLPTCSLPHSPAILYVLRVSNKIQTTMTRKIILETTMVKIPKTSCSVYSESIMTRVDTIEQ